MNVEIVGYVSGVDKEKGELHFTLMGLNKKMKLDIFRNIKRFKGYELPIRNKILELIGESRSRFTVRGHCYNSHTMIADWVKFQKEDHLNKFLDYVISYKKEMK